MAEAAAVIGLVSSIASLVELSARVVSRLREFTSQASDVPGSLHSLLVRLPLLTATLQRIQTQAEAGVLSDDVAEALKAVVDNTSDQIAAIQTRLSKILPHDGASKLERALKALRSLANEDKVQQALEKIHKNNDILVLHQTTRHVDTGDRILEEISKLSLSPPVPSNLLGVSTVSPPTSRPSHTIPFRPDPDYVQRDVYEELWRRSCEPASRVALVGLGGVGKSQLAITYAHQVRTERPEVWVFWVHASNATRFEEGYKTIAERVRIPGLKEPKADILGLVSTWLCDEGNGRWVMIVDNADVAAVMFDSASGITSSTGLTDRSLSDYVPQVTHGSVVITSRSRDVAYRLTGRMEDILDVLPMDVDTSVALLRKKLGSCASDEDTIRLVQSLDGMPLAITQAAAYIGRRAPRMTVSKYLQELSRSDTDRTRLLQRDVGDPRRDGRASNSIITTWHVLFVHIRQEAPSAARLLALMSLFDREGIPASLLHGYTKEGEENADFEDDVDTLRSHCLVRLGREDNTFEMHQLVQFSTKKWLEQQGELQRWQELFIDNMLEALPTIRYGYWAECERLFPHTEAAVMYRPTAPEYLTRWATILFRASFYAVESGQETRAKVMARESLTAFEKVLGREHPLTLTSVSVLAMALQDQGQYEAAEEMNRRALQGYEKVFGREHPTTLTSVSNLAMVLRHRGQYKTAEEMSRQALQGWEKLQDQENPLKLASINNLTTVLQDQGHYEAAGEMTQRALQGCEKMFGREHPFTLLSVSNLALALRRQGQYKVAEEMGRRALQGREKVLGREHPHTLMSVSVLATVLQDQGQYEAAEEMIRRALRGREKVLGREHPNTLTSVNSLAMVLHDQGQYEAAEEIYRQALQGREKVLGREHPDTLASVGNLSTVLQDQGQSEAAEETGRRALRGREKVFGREHPTTLTGVNNLALVIQDQGQYKAAEAMIRRALQGREKVLGREHPDTLTSVINLARVLQDQGQYEAAEEMNRRALQGYEKVFGQEHPSTLMSVSHLAAVLGYRGQYEAAEQMGRRALQGQEKLLGREHPDTLKSLYSLAVLLEATVRFEEAFVMYERALRGYRKKLGSSHPSTRACEAQFMFMLKRMANVATNVSHRPDAMTTKTR